MSDKNDRTFKFESKTDFKIYLGLLIEHVYKHFSRYKEYFNELQEMTLKYIGKFDGGNHDIDKKNVILEIEKVSKFRNYSELRKTIIISYKEYKELEDKLATPSNELLNFFGDRTSNAVSYIKFRDVVKDRKKKFSKQSKEDDLKLDELEEQIRQNLNGLNEARNYHHHIPDTKFITQWEYREKQLQEFGLIDMEKFFEIIRPEFYEKIDIEWLWHLYKVSKARYETYDILFQRMKKDYSILIGTSMSIMPDRIETSLPVEYGIMSFNSYKLHQGKTRST